MLGMPRSRRETWIRKEVKLPAFTAVQAIILHRFMLSSCEANFKNSASYEIRYFYRAVLEYQKLDSPGYVRENFKLLKEYSEHELEKLFEKWENSKK